MLNEYDLESIAFCAISTGIFKYDPAEAAAVFAKTINKVIQNKEKNNKSLILIKIINFEQDKTTLFINEFKKVFGK